MIGNQMKKTVKIGDFVVTDPKQIDDAWRMATSIAVYIGCQVLGSVAMFGAVVYIWWHS